MIDNDNIPKTAEQQLEDLIAEYRIANSTGDTGKFTLQAAKFSRENAPQLLTKLKRMQGALETIAATEGETWYTNEIARKALEE